MLILLKNGDSYDIDSFRFDLDNQSIIYQGTDKVYYSILLEDIEIIGN